MRVANLSYACCLVATFAVFVPREAVACGCFTPPDPVTPTVQAGERILFSVNNGQVTAVIQIQFSGAAAEFGWLLPLPSVPTLEVSSDEVFNALAAGTAPAYEFTMNWVGGTMCYFSPDFGAAGGGDPGDPLVLSGGVGPYDFAVLKADDKTAMLGWLMQNRYFVPAGTDTAVVPYIHPGAYFLALKLKPGASAGDLRPVVVHYASDLPMIPITLTSATATQDMGVWAWVLGPSRAIPRNYHHVVLNDAALNWRAGTPGNYEERVTKAVNEAPGHHAFLTEAAMPVAKLKDRVFNTARFGDLAGLRQLKSADEYLGYLRSNGFTFSSTLVGILQKYIKQPAKLALFGAEPSPASYYYNFAFWRFRNPNAFINFDLSFDPVALTDEIDKTIIAPARPAVALFNGANYLTRLHTRLSPADMNSDPVFSFNPDLPEVSNVHHGVMDSDCSQGYLRYAMLHTEQGFEVQMPDRQSPPPMPGALRIETVSESGMPKVLVDNTDLIRTALGQKDPVDMGAGPGGDDGGTGGSRDLGTVYENDVIHHTGCSVASGTPRYWLAGLLTLAALGLAVRRRR